MLLWKEIPGYEGQYKVSNEGNIASITRKTRFGDSYRYYYGKELKQSFDKDGYLKISLSKDGVKKRFFVHRLVAMTFIPNDAGLPVINHKDGIKTNNHVSNLEWCTVSQNTKHAFDIGLRTPHNGGTNKELILTDANGEVIREFDSMTSAATFLGITTANVSYRIKNGKNSLKDGSQLFLK